MTDQPSTAQDHLLAIHRAAESVLMSTTSQHAAALGRLLQLDVDIRSWESMLSPRPEVRQLTDARRELGFGIYALSSGLYVHSYAGLRLFLELSFASVYFSANELLRRRWKADREDFSWKRALDENDGVLAPTFVQEFSEAAVSDASHYAKVASDCYRHCSQFVHGKLAVTDALPDNLSFTESVAADWLKSAQEAAEAVLYLLYARYGDELLPQDDGKLTSTLENAFLHLVHIRERLGLPVEDGGRNVR